MGYLKDLQRLVKLRGVAAGIQYFNFACEVGFDDFVQYLVGLGVDGYSREIGCARAASRGQLGPVRYLVSIGVDIRAGHDRCVQSAAAAGWLRTVRYLVSIGADVRAAGDKCLIYAAVEQNEEVMQYVIGLGADVRACNSYARALGPGGHGSRINSVLKARGGARTLLVGKKYLEGLAAATRVIYSAVLARWIPRCYDRRRRAGRRMGRRNLAAFRRLCI